MAALSCFPWHRKRPVSLDWILKFEDGHLSYKIICTKLFCKLMYTRHVAIVFVLGERESGKSLILDALLRRLFGKDVSIFSNPHHLLVDRSDEIVISSDPYLLKHSGSEDIGVVFIDVRSSEPSSPYYSKLMNLACKFATVKLISHYKTLSPELFQMATGGVIIHAESSDVRWDGVEIHMSDYLYGRVYNAIQDVQYYSEHTKYFCLNKRLHKVYQDQIDSQQRHEELHGHPDQPVKSKHLNNYSTPWCMPEPAVSSSSVTSNTVPMQSAYFGPHVHTKPPQYPRQHEEFHQTSTISWHSQNVPIYEDDADDEASPENLTTAPPPSRGNHSTQAQFNTELKAPRSYVSHCQFHSRDLKRGNAFNATSMCGIAKVLPTVLPNSLVRPAYNIMQSIIPSHLLPSSVKLTNKFQPPSPRHVHPNNQCLPLQEYTKVAPSSSNMILPKTQKSKCATPMPMTTAETGRQVPEEESHLFETECALQAVQHAVTKFNDNVLSVQLALMTTKDQSNLLSSYATLIVEAFKSVNSGPAWKQVADNKLRPRLENYMKELRQANKNTMRRWDKTLDSALRKCGQVYHAEMQRFLPSNTKVSTKELENHHLNAIEPTVRAFSVPAEINVPTRARWDVVLDAKLEEWKGGFVYLNEKTPEPVKITAPLQRKEQASVGIYLRKSSILVAVVTQDCGRPITYQRQFSPFISFSEQGCHIVEDNGDFNIYEILTEPTVPRDPKTLNLGQDFHSITQEMAAILYMTEVKKVLDDVCGMDASFACVVIQEHISGAAKTSIKQSLLMGGFAHVQLIPCPIAIAVNLIQKQPEKMCEIFSIHHSASIFYISRIAIKPGNGFNLEKTAWTIKLTTKVVTKCLNSIIKTDSASPPTAVIVEEEEGYSAEISRHVLSFGFGVSHDDLHKIEPSDTTIAIANYAKLRRQRIPTLPFRHPDHYDMWITGCTERLLSRCKKTHRDSIWIEHSESKADGGLLIQEGFDKESARDRPLWSYPFQISTPVVNGPVCALTVGYDRSIGIEKLEGVNARVTSVTCKFLSQWDRQVLAKDVKQCLAVWSQPKSIKEMIDERGGEQDDSARGQLTGLIKKLRDSLEDPAVVVGPVRDLLFERMELYSDVLANECASERDLQRALLKLRAVTEGIL